MKSSDYVDLAIKKTGAKNDNQLCVLMGWSKSKMNNYRHNRQAMDNEASRVIAEILEVPVLQVIADMEAQRQKDPAKKKAWKLLSSISSQSGKSSPNLLFSIAFFSGVSHLVYILC